MTTRKILWTLTAMLACLSLAHAQDFMTDIDSQAVQLVDNCDVDDDEDELLYDFYSAQIAQCDSDKLAMYPELVFRRAVAWSSCVDLDDDSIASAMDSFAQISQEYAFVLDNADQDSRLFQATTIQKSFIDAIVAAAPASADQFFTAAWSNLDTLLRPWAAGSTATGSELRQVVLSNIQQDPDLMSSFCDFLLLLEDDPHISLGYAEPVQVTVQDQLFTSEDDGSQFIQYEILYKTPGIMHTIESGI